MIARAALIGLLAAAPAHAQDDPFDFLVSFEQAATPGVREVGTFGFDVGLTGALAVDFHGDETTGCAATGLCGVEGTVTWTPGGSAGAIVLEYVQDGRRRMAGLLGLAPEPLVAADVRRRAPDGSVRRCVDAHHGGAALSLAPAGDGLELVPPGSAQTTDVLRTRCAGPLQADLRAALPSRVLDRATLRRGRAVVDLRGERAFAAGGLAGTVRSTLVLRLGRSRADDDGEGRRRRKRVLTATYAIERIDGSATATVAGAADTALCELVDACGSAGAVTATPGTPGRGTVTLTATAPARRPWRDLRAALGLARRSEGGNIDVSGEGQWTGGTGTTTATMRRADGAPACTDRSPLAAGWLQFEPRGAGLQVGLFAGPNALLTRCAGIGGADVGAELARGRVGRLRGRRTTLHLTRNAEVANDAYAGRVSADIRVTLRRTGTRRATILDDG